MTVAQESKLSIKKKKKEPIRSWKEYYDAFPNPLPKGKTSLRGRPSKKKNVNNQESSDNLILSSDMVIQISWKLPFYI
jgi:hypothetical protein